MVCGGHARRSEAHGGERCPKETVGTLHTGVIVSEGVCTLPTGPGVQSPARTGSVVYKVGLCALEGVFRRGFVHCPEATTGTLYTRGVVSEGVCTRLADPSVQSPFQTGPPVYKVGPCLQASSDCGRR